MRWSRSPNTALYGPLGCPYWYPNITWFSLPRAPRAGGGKKGPVPTSYTPKSAYTSDILVCISLLCL